MAVPAKHQQWVDRLRTFLSDTKELNELKELEESTDQELYWAIQDALDEINFEVVPGVRYNSIDEVPSWNILKTGATLQILTSKGILSARNHLSFNDAGGITIRDHDEHGRYINYFNVLVNKYLRGATAMKINDNINNGYGGVASEYGFLD